MNSKKILMVIVPDVLSRLIKKGEVTDRYYNPGNYFDEVHLVLVNDDRPDLAATQKMVGRAVLHVHALPPPNFYLSLGWNWLFCQFWVLRMVELATRVKPQLIRCHGSGLNAWAASRIKKALGVPYVISLHINPDDDLWFHALRERRWKRLVFLRLLRWSEKLGIRNANLVVCVYEFIRSYAVRMSAPAVRVLYNATNPTTVIKKNDYTAQSPFRVICVGRQFEQKDPSPLIKAVSLFDQNIHLTLVGDGPIHDSLVSLSEQCEAKSRCTFLKSLPNDEICRTLANYDLFVSINDFGGISKAEIEAARVGMPIVTNAHPLEANPELIGGNCWVVQGDAASYLEALNQAYSQDELRKKYGQGSREAVRNLDPEKIEAEWVQIYQHLMNLN